MPSNNNRINFQVGYNVDQSSVNAVKKSLQDLQNIKLKDFSGTKQDLENIRQIAGQVQTALNKAFNVNLNSLNTQKFNSQLASSKLTIDGIYQSFSKAGAQGQVAFSRMASSVLTTNMQLKQTNSLISSMGQTMANTVKWGVASSVMNNFTNSVQQAFQYVKSLDSALTDIRIVTGDSTEQMRSFAQEANKAAQSLGRSTMDYTKAALSFYQQGLSDEEVQARTESVLKAQNITGAGQEMADYLTAVWNGYKVANEEAELYVDKLAAVADSSASNMSQLAVAMSKVASTANTMGVDVDQLNAQIATIVATTRQAPESVGNALKTIYTRINDIATGADGAQISLGNYSKKMAEVGINVLDANGKLRDTGQVIEEVGSKWAGMSKEQQIYLARTMAGQRQINNMTALFDNWSKYTDLVNVSLDAQGTTMEKNERYMDSLGAKMEQFGAAGERVKDALINEEDLKGIVDFGTSAVDLFANLVESIGGGGNALLAFGSIFTQLFSGTIAKEINNVVTNIQNAKNNVQILANDIKNTQTFGQSQGYKDGTITAMVDAKKAAQQYYDFMSNSQKNQYNQIVRQIGASQDKVNILNQQIKKANEFQNAIKDSLVATIDEKDALRDMLNSFSGKEGLTNLAEQGSLDLLKNQIQDLRNTVNQSAVPAFKEFDDAIENIKDPANATAQELRAVRDAAQKVFNQTNTGVDLVLSLDQTKEKAKEASASLTLAKNAANQYLQAVKQFANIKTFVDLAAGAGKVASGIMSLINLTKVWNNQNLTAGEKILQTVTNLSMSLPMLITGLTTVIKTFKTFGTVLRQQATLQELLNIAHQKHMMLSVQDVNAMNAQQIAYLKSTFAKYSDLTATEALALGMKHLAASIWDAIAPFAPYVIAIGAVVAAGVLLYKEWNKQSEAAQKAAQSAKKTKETYEDLKSTYDNLKSSLEDYNSAQEAISEMTKGTQEWRDAIRESNDAVLQLIKNYPQLAKYVSNVNGQLQISEAGQQQALKKSAAAVDNARLASIAADAQASNAAFRSSAREATRSVGVQRNDEFIGATVDQVTKVIQAYSNTVAATTEQQAKLISEQTGISQDMVKAILEGTKNIDQLSTQLEANTEANKLAYETLASERLQEDKTYQGLDTLGQQLVNSIAGSDLQNAELDRIDHWMSVMTDGVNKLSGANNANVQEMLVALNKAQGTNWGLASNAVRGTDSNRTFAFLDQQGELVEWSAKQVAATIAASQALEGLSGSAEKATDILSDIQGLSGSSSEAMKDYIANQGFGNLEKDQLSGLDFTSGQIDSFIENHYAELGYDTGQQFTDQLIKAQQASLKDWDSIGEGSLKPVQEAITNLFEGQDFTLNAAKSIGEGLNNAFEQAGNKGLFSLKDLFGTASQDDIDEIAKAFANADISTPQGLLELQNALKQIGNGSILASQEWGKFKDAVEGSQFKNPLDDIFEQQSQVSGITKNIKSNSVISEQDYNTLLAVNNQIEKMFRRTAEGYQFISQKGSLIQLLTGGTNGFIEAANSFDTLKEQAILLADQFGQDFQAGLLEKSSLSKAIEGAMSQINVSEDTKEQMYAALGMNQDALQAVLERYNQLIQQHRLTDEQESEFKQLQQDLQGFLDTAAGAPQIFNQMTQSLRDAAAMGSQTLSELNDLFANGDISGQQFGAALATVSDRQMQDLGFNVDEYETLVNLLQQTNEEMAQNQYLARQMAKANMRISKGTEDLIKNWQDWNSLLEDFQQTGDVSTIAGSWDQMREAFANLFDADRQSIDMLGPDFIANNLDKIQDVKNGVEGAYEELSALMDQELILKAYGVADFSQLDQDVQDAFNMIQQVSNDATVQVGAVFSGEDDLIRAFNNIVAEANWTSDQAQAAFSKMGYDVQFQEKPDATHTATENTQYYVPPTYTTQSLPYDLGPFGSGNLSIPVVSQGGHYESAPGGTKETYEPGAYSVRTVTKNGKGSGGNISRRKVNSTPTKSSSGGGGGRSPKGSSKSPSKPSNIKQTSYSKKKEKEKDTGIRDPYHDVNLQLEEQDRILDKIQDQEDHLTGKERLKNLKEQNKVLEKQNKLLNKKSDIAIGQATRLKTELKGQLGNGISFNADGSIANYNQAQKNALKQYNDAVTAYNKNVRAAEKQLRAAQAKQNKMSTKEQQQAYQSTVDKLKKSLQSVKTKEEANLQKEKDKYDAIKENIKEYQETLELLKKIEDQERANLQAEIDHNIANSKITVDLALDTGDFQRGWLDFENKFIKKIDKKDLFSNAKASADQLMSYFNSDAFNQTNNQIDKILADIKLMQDGKVANIYGDPNGQDVSLNRLGDAQKDLRDYLQQQMNNLKNIQDLVDQISDSYLDSLDDAKDRMDDQIDQYERINDIINHNVRLTQLLYGDKAYGTMQKYYNLQKANNDTEMQQLKTQQEYWQKMMNSFVGQNGQIINEDAFKKAKDNFDDLTDQVQSKLEDMIQNLSDQWENRVDGIIAKLNNALTGGRGLDYLDEQWDYINDFDDNFLDTFESKMGIQEVINLYQQAIDGLSGSPANQQKINKLMNDQLKILREKDNLTQYDIDRAKAALQVQKARMALEDSRYNKTKMRLRRDSQGNYTYQYVADEQKLEDLQSALTEAQANLYNTDKEHYQQNLNNLYDTYKNYLERMKDLQEQYREAEAAGDAAEMQRVQARMDLAAQQFNKLYEGLSQDNKYALQYLAESFSDGMGIDRAAYSAAEFSQIMNNNIPYMTSNIQDLRDTIAGDGGLINATSNAMKEIGIATQDYNNNIQQTLNNAGTSLNNIMQATDSLGNSLDTNIQQVEKLIPSYNKLIDTSINAISQIKSVMDTVNTSLNGLISDASLENLGKAYNVYQKINDEAINIGLNDGTISSAFLKGKDYDLVSDEAKNWGLNYAQVKDYNQYMADSSNSIDFSNSLSSSLVDAIEKVDLSNLSDVDAESLSAILQYITNSMDAIASNQIASISSGANGYIGSINNVEHLDQNVHIEANFPNVTQHTEIEQAFNNLVNMASMRASGYRD